jgi:hypothetical protein
MLAVGVGLLGEQEQPVPLVLSANATGTDSEGQDRVATVLELVSKSPPRPGSIGADSGGVLSEYKARAKRINNAEEFSAERRRSRSCRNSGPAVLLARVAADEEVAGPFGRIGGRKGSGVVVAPRGGPMVGEDGSGTGVNLHLECAHEAGLLQPQIEPGAPGIQRPEDQRPGAHLVVASARGSGGSASVSESPWAVATARRICRRISGSMPGMPCPVIGVSPTIRWSC